MEVILLERVGKLGTIGDIVSVKAGYARNYLLPQGKALRANDANKARFEAERAEIERRNADALDQAKLVAEKVDGEVLVMIRSASDAGALYGSVTPRDIADALIEGGFEIARNQVVLQGPIKELGIHTAAIVLHPDATAEVKINVARSEDEAKLQAEGKSVIELAADAEAAAEAELAELLDEVGAASEDADGDDE